jgi:hypothetical protein
MLFIAGRSGRDALHALRETLYWALSRRTAMNNVGDQSLAGYRPVCLAAHLPHQFVQHEQL